MTINILNLQEIPIGRLIAKKPGDNVEFAQWFYKFYQANKSKTSSAGAESTYDPLLERRKRGIHLEACDKSDSSKPKPRSVLVD